MKNTIKRVLGFFVCVNTALFLLLACLHKFPIDAKSAIFIDFWGRFTVYSLWFIGFVLYRKYLKDFSLAKGVVVFAVCANIPCFLLLAYFDKVRMNDETIVLVDFWGRLTVYSFWVICYETYRAYMATDAQTESP